MKGFIKAEKNLLPLCDPEGLRTDGGSSLLAEGSSAAAEHADKEQTTEGGWLL